MLFRQRERPVNVIPSDVIYKTQPITRRKTGLIGFKCFHITQHRQGAQMPNWLCARRICWQGRMLI